MNLQALASFAIAMAASVGNAFAPGEIAAFALVAR